MHFLRTPVSKKNYITKQDRERIASVMELLLGNYLLHINKDKDITEMIQEPSFPEVVQKKIDLISEKKDGWFDGISGKAAPPLALSTLKKVFTILQEADLPFPAFATSVDGDLECEWNNCCLTIYADRPTQVNIWDPSDETFTLPIDQEKLAHYLKITNLVSFGK